MHQAVALPLQRKLRHTEALDPDYEVRAQSISCAGCGLYLGLRLMQLGKQKLGLCE